MIRIAIVCEANADFVLASCLADRLFQDRIQWIEPEYLDSIRTWVGGDPNPASRFLSWREVAEKARELNIKVHGTFQGASGEPDAQAGARALRILKRIHADLKGVILMRDSDNDLRRRQGLRQARTTHGTSLAVVVGVAHTKRECWVLAGFVPVTPDEDRQLLEEKKRLGFDPTVHSHQLTAKHDPRNDLRSAKRVLASLTGNDRTRESECWQATPLSKLRDQGDSSGLKEFLNEIDEHLVPLFSNDCRKS
ncbi:MAG: hypothetical protein NT069_01635 [Planctomycetota bacterium]|nr:hypothetical protein [Planctomycetota bacterium]